MEMRKVKAWLIRAGKLFAVLLGLVLIAGLVWCRHAIYHRLIRFPKEQAAWEALRAQRTPVPKGEWNEYRGILHSHSLYSHDCEVRFEEILTALKRAKVDFICLSDHCPQGHADFSLQWRGIYDGKLFIPGFEMKEGMMPFGVKSGVILSNSTPTEVLARQVAEDLGVLFFAHSEEPRQWQLPELTGMEIYNIHTDFKRYRPGFTGLIPELLLNQRRYPEHVCRLIFHCPEEFLQRWDELNRTRHITGIAGNDCHQNTGVRIIYRDRNTLVIEDTSSKRLCEWKLNWLTRPLARVCFGPLTPGKQVFHFQLDPYERMGHYVNTHVLARDLSEASILEALRAGRAFVGFDMLADSSGFSWRAKNHAGTAAPGEALPFTGETELEALSPVPCRLTVKRNGQTVRQVEGRELHWHPSNPGKYRVEAEIKVVKDWVPWVYANPVELR